MEINIFSVTFNCQAWILRIECSLLYFFQHLNPAACPNNFPFGEARGNIFCFLQFFVFYETIGLTKPKNPFTAGFLVLLAAQTLTPAVRRGLDLFPISQEIFPREEKA